jgi:phosphohistidine phosphatase
MDVYFLRHANAGESLADARADEKRQLDKLGIEQAQRMGRLLKALGVKIDAILSSPLVRAKQTAALAATEMGYTKSVLLDKGLRPQAKFEEFKEILQRHSKHEAIMVVGHNPNQSEFLSLLVSDEATAETIELKKGGLAKLEWKPRRSDLLWVLTPKLVQTIEEASATSSRPKTSRK